MNWKSDEAGKSAKHKWLYSNFGRPLVCEDPSCEGKAKIFEWCIKKGKKFSHNRNDYLRLCRSCHRKYDLTPEKKRKAIRNLWWNNNRITGNAKLNETNVRDIRSLLKRKFNCSKIARSYGVNKTTISLIKRRITWKNVI